MIAHDQTIPGTSEPGGTPGNCMQAVVASLLDLPMEQVPHFALFGDWRTALALYLDGIGKRLRVYADDNPQAWAHTHVLTYRRLYAPTGQMMIAVGDSPRGPWPHVVVWKGGRAVHDPHESRDGLNSVPTEFWQVTDA